MSEQIYPIVSGITSIIMMLIIVNNMIVEKLKWYAQAVIIIYLTGFSVLAQLVVHSQLTTIPMIVILLGLVVTFTRKKSLNVLCILFGYVGGVALNYICLLISDTVFKVPISQFAERYFYLLFYAIFLTLLYAMTKALHYILVVRLQIASLRTKGPLYSLLLIQMTGCAGIFIFNIVAGEFEGYPSDIIQVNCFLLTGYVTITYIIFGMVIQNLNHAEKMQQLMEEYEKAGSYEQENEQRLDELRQFKHNYLNVFQGMEDYLQQENIQGLRQYYEEVVAPVREDLQALDFKIMQLAHIKIPELKSLICGKVVDAMKKDIEVQLYLESEVQDIGMESYHLLSVVGIFLDNAIEAAENAEHKELVVQIEKEEGWIFEISNTFGGEIPELEKLANPGVSTKGFERGYGLYSVERILKKYKNIENVRRIRAPYFTQRLEIGERI